MAVIALKKDESLSLGIALLAHAALVAVLLLGERGGTVVKPPERIVVTLSEDVAPTSTSPDPSAQAAPDVAPEIGEAAPAAEPAPPAPAPEPQPVERVQPAPQPRPEPRPQPRPEPPRPVAKPAPKPVPRATPRPTPPKPVAKPAPKPAPKAAAKPTPKQQPAKQQPAKPATSRTSSIDRIVNKSGSSAPTKAATPPKKAGGSRIGDDFLEGVPSGQAATRSNSQPAAAIGPAVKSSLASAISRQLKPRWQAPQGPEAEDLVTILAFNLNKDGTLAGSPRVVRQLGITDVNRAQADRHAEQAVRAVQLAAPFNLPEEYYDAWKRVSEFRFDRRLSQ